jgi:hypothetical protein
MKKKKEKKKLKRVCKNVENESTYIGKLLCVLLISTVHLVAEREQAVRTSLSRHRVVCKLLI